MSVATITPIFESEPTQEVEAVTGQGSERKAIVPTKLRSQGAVKAMGADVLHATGFHALRMPLYYGRIAAHAPRGFGRTVGATARWAVDTKTLEVRHMAKQEGDLKRLEDNHNRWMRHLRFRSTVLGLGGSAFAAGGFYLHQVMSSPEHGGLATLAAGLGIGAFGLIGRARDERILNYVTDRSGAPKLTQDLIIPRCCHLATPPSAATPKPSSSFNR
jgi:DNA segregation ATPase FtsK/SpoIIIE, S-DNA-T family